MKFQDEECRQEDTGRARQQSMTADSAPRREMTYGRRLRAAVMSQAGALSIDMSSFDFNGHDCLMRKGAATPAALSWRRRAALSPPLANRPHASHTTRASQCSPAGQSAGRAAARAIGFR